MAEMRETAAKTKEPEVLLTFASGAEALSGGVGNKADMAKTSSFLSGREEPLFRLAVQP
jgi:hypothetical protein